ncbi:hypothetical protein DFQ27_005908, partial [Actinomortierella ambigua]
IRDLRRTAFKLLRQRSFAMRTLAASIGKAIAVTMAVFPARLLLQHPLQLQSPRLASGTQWSEEILVSEPTIPSFP